MIWPAMSKVQWERLPVLFKSRTIYIHLGISLVLNWVVAPFIMAACAWIALPEASMDRERRGVLLVGVARCIAMVMCVPSSRLCSSCAVELALTPQLAHLDAASGPASLRATATIAPSSSSSTRSCRSSSSRPTPSSSATSSACAPALTSPNSASRTTRWQRRSASCVRLSPSLQPQPRLALDLTLLSTQYLGIPLAAGAITRVIAMTTLSKKRRDQFFGYFGLFGMLGLLYVIIVLFMSQGRAIIDNIGTVFRICVPCVLVELSSSRLDSLTS